MAKTTKNLRLLSLDGGGVRGLSSLLILRRIFHVLDQKLDSSWKRPLKPCQFFDLIAGTSTGGLIAIMLGTLGMKIDDCIQEYLELAPKIFPTEGFVVRSKPSKLFKAVRGSARFDAMALENEVKKLVEKYLRREPDSALEDVPLSEDSCRV
jgi:patatin-like phospholipase/acyl hydrolase